MWFSIPSFPFLELIAQSYSLSLKIKTLWIKSFLKWRNIVPHSLHRLLIQNARISTGTDAEGQNDDLLPRSTNPTADFLYNQITTIPSLSAF